MRSLRFNVAMSLDGYLARTGGEFDWIVEDSSIDFAALTSEFDTALMGRRTYDVMRSMGPEGAVPGLKIVVCSTTLRQDDAPDVTIVSSNVVRAVEELKKADGKDIWLFGGGILFRTLLDGGLVDTVEVAIMPVMLGRGIQMLPGVTRDAKLTLRTARPLPSGVVLLTYDVGRPLLRAVGDRG